ncbi:hypothetical protein E2C01_063605 [Portunus trituberculatus]|uniref:Uncharacterized protein n=1 Tax=Portunus trituberculatus TaxID=210409 RepID=A0A5B7HE49_PORTR|nr:hypothetical protein [Portunus trituberculatus]
MLRPQKKISIVLRLWWSVCISAAIGGTLSAKFNGGADVTGDTLLRQEALHLIDGWDTGPISSTSAPLPLSVHLSLSTSSSSSFYSFSSSTTHE